MGGVLLEFNSIANLHDFSDGRNVFSANLQQSEFMQIYMIFQMAENRTAPRREAHFELESGGGGWSSTHIYIYIHIVAFILRAMCGVR